MISVENISVHFGSFELFNNISFVINTKDRIGLIGKNGAGKTTLLKILAKDENAKTGNIVYPQEITLGYLPQQMQFSSSKTVWQETMEAFDQIITIENEISNINEALTSRTDYESESYLKLTQDLAEKTDAFLLLGGSNVDEETEKILTGLGFLPNDFQRECNEFSGGWRMRIELAKILLRKPNLLLLDEPTNHLDIESIQWLEDYLKIFQGAVLVVSHDKAFLDNVTNRTIEISLGKIYDYKLPYSRFLEQRQEQRKQQMAAYLNQQKMIDKTEDFIERFRYKATKAVQVQSKIKQLKKLERIEVEATDISNINIKFPPCPHSGKIVLEAKNLTKKYDDNLILNDIDFVLERGEKVAFIGKNGEGKTTLSRILTGNLDYTGEMKIGHQVKIGYFAQNQDEILDEDKTVFQTLDDIAVGDIRTKIRDILGAFLFPGEDIDKKVKVLSGGERSRLAIAKLLLEPVNLLVLDEPTNHLDIHSKEILKQALRQYDGSFILVSHDRDFLHGLTEKLYEFKNHGIKEYMGDVYEFLQLRKMAHLNELNTKKTAAHRSISQQPSTNKLSFEQRKEQERKIRKLRNKIGKTENEIEQLENLLAEMTEDMAKPENAANQEIFSSFQKNKTALEGLMNDWEKLHTELEKSEAEKT
ncbi:MAG: ABC-F family ATP-binding cassette domain-containing protein [Bacteroidales bacterium]|nr:ABC-F family ATP-binding cassette domain-containing protein [Bacteroidales bacterium]